MTDNQGDQPFPGFPGFPPAEMLDKMWSMMRLTPFGSAFPGTQPGTAQGFPSPLSAMSDMMTPLTNVEELDKRITDLRAVEQWLKLNLNMLQSAIQGLEVQRATLATLRAFGAFAQASMTQPAAGEASAASAASAKPSGTDSAPREESAGAKEDEAARDAGAFDPTAWWNVLQSQFNQLASFAVSQPGAAPEAKPDGPDDAAAGARKTATGSSAKTGAKSSPKRSSTRKPAGGAPASSNEK
ncbi:transcriptional regulator [Paraburkholderia sp. NMBU_R16]|uniref:PhaM family polyhydroxyalkanoate granule multifunctional regulatory protein n=1 Tax=Paraburkholderia sp. NMBU_R16 TaxID=2698676 RepID=UPI001563138B|nr:PhaM family polyhydroxyalkanoate granule multifunctional regulatory protein [Paraburkholderia sp. NMBU_R16]NRO94525.1 transcriptional regulator [Paraburkholderia sp. NMBU_R16]